MHCPTTNSSIVLGEGRIEHPRRRDNELPGEAVAKATQNSRTEERAACAAWSAALFFSPSDCWACRYRTARLYGAVVRCLAHPSEILPRRRHQRFAETYDLNRGTCFCSTLVFCAGTLVLLE